MRHKVKQEREAEERARFDLWFNENVNKACRDGLLAHGSFYLPSEGSCETIRLFPLLSALDAGLRALLKNHDYSPHQAMMHGKILPLSTDPYEAPKEDE